jgi:hypothetical protein
VTTVLIDGVWALRLGFEKPGMARLEGAWAELSGLGKLYEGA